jgi:hypothetical protein
MLGIAARQCSSYLRIIDKLSSKPCLSLTGGSDDRNNRIGGLPGQQLTPALLVFTAAKVDFQAQGAIAKHPRGSRSDTLHKDVSLILVRTLQLHRHCGFERSHQPASGGGTSRVS